MGIIWRTCWSKCQRSGGIFLTLCVELCVDVIIIEQFLMSANSSGLQIVLVCLYSTPSHNHHCANLSKDIELSKCLSDIFFECVRLSIFSQLSIVQYVGLCVFSLPIYLVMIGSIYILCLIIIIKSEVWTITHCWGLGHKTIVCAVCLSIFLSSSSIVIIIIIIIKSDYETEPF